MASLPGNSRSLHPAGCAVLVVDLQECFFTDPTLQSRRERIVTATQRIVRQARRAGVPVIDVRTEHLPDRSTWTLNMLEDEQGFAFSGTLEARTLHELDLSDAVPLVKTRDSAFVGTDLAALLAGLDVGTVLLCGVTTRACIFLTAADAYAHDLHPVLVEDGLGDDLDDEARHSLQRLVREYRAQVLRSQDLEHRWGR